MHNQLPRGHLKRCDELEYSLHESKLNASYATVGDVEVEVEGGGIENKVK
jgi:hypothetical protein